MLKLFVVILVYYLFEYGVLAESRTNFDVSRFEKCATDGTIEYSINFTKQNHQHYIDTCVKSPIPLDNNIGMIIFIETSLNGKIFLPLFTIREKDFCKAMSKYLGEFWYDMERAAQIPVGVCPIREGKYCLHHFLMNFHKIAVQTLPFGTLRFTYQALNKRTNKIVFCAVMETENIEN